MRLGYVRSFKSTSSPLPQIERLLQAGCEAIFVEQGSGDNMDRPVLHRVMDSLRPDDVLVVVSAERFSREQRQLTILTERLQARGATLQVLEVEDSLPEAP
ncbi:DNA invertase Pin-like site-specific DNA recombinase [Deinobacterium chartae]|uniref:DNA invertase Pin-like site-specific DNA recombinase n=1 Tax=Deinobacterium chartae TaxID=521158 RepID=A0A841HYW4_9DEIO|nr:recombinase family protein [Deinobacterium chartae]MBB6096955.1 DNA invertase Pin-like site-specific DNA recombinase [Deinobacterium chartae]